MYGLGISSPGSVFNRKSGSKGGDILAVPHKTTVVFKDDSDQNSSFGIEMSASSSKDAYISRSTSVTDCCCCCVGGGGGADGLRNK